MKIKSTLTLVILVVTLVFLAGWTSRAEPSSKTNWEYKAVTLWHAEVVNPNVNRLNNMGEEGWELVTIIASDVRTDNAHQTKLTCYFKRPL